MIEATLFILGGLWRWIDGRSWRPSVYQNWLNLMVLGIITFYCLNNSVGNWVDDFKDANYFDVIVFFVLMSCTGINLLMGFKSLTFGHGWTSWHMAHRFLWLGTPAIIINPWYAVFCVIAGLGWPVCTRMGWHTGYAEFVAGACIIGGLSVL